MIVIKSILHSEKEEPFNKDCIVKSIIRAMKTGSGVTRPRIANLIADEIEEKFSSKEKVKSSEINNQVLKKLNEYGQSLTANAYERFKTVKQYQSVDNPLDKDIYGIIDGTNEAVINENSNKNADLASTERDLIAGSFSRSYSERKLIPPHLQHAHEQGLIHIHDTDYLINHIHNCQLINLKDMLDNGTVINGKMIETPKSFLVAATVTSQISLAVANGQYGGQTFSVAHLAPYVRVSFNKWKDKIKKSREQHGVIISDEGVENLAWEMTRQEVKDGVQTIQFQENTFSSSNGQTPFVSIFMYVNEDPEYKVETAMIIEEMLNLRYKGMLNEHGVWVSPAFPKLLYVLDENNVEYDSEYGWLTKLAEKCSAKRSNPDFISAKVMREHYEGNVFPCMGAVGGEEVIIYKIGVVTYVESFTRMWKRLSEIFTIESQFDEENPNVMMWLNDVSIYDSKENRFVECKNIIRNVTTKWQRVTFDNGRSILCTLDHPFTLTNGETVQVDNLKYGDEIDICTGEIFTNDLIGPNTLGLNESWLLGFALFKFDINKNVSATFSSYYDSEAFEYMKGCMKDLYKFNVLTKKHSDSNKENSSYYYDIDVDCKSLKYDLIDKFEGIGKNNRHIPNVIFRSDKNVKLSFLAGLIDGDGYITADSTVEIHTLNKELALQIVALAQSCGMQSMFGVKTYTNKYGVPCRRNKVIFKPTEELVSFIKSSKKIANYSKDAKPIDLKSVGKVVAIDEVIKTDYSYDVETETEHFTVSSVWSHNCRSFLSPWKDENGNYKFYGRFNRGVVTINLPDVALSANKDIENFWGILDERLELVKEALIMRHNLLKNVSVNKSPIHWKYGSIARLKGDNFNDVLENGYSSISLGYIGLYEMSQALFGHPHTDPDYQDFAIKVMEYLEAKAKMWSDTIPELKGCSVYGTPSESLCYKFALKTRKRFGIVKNVTDKEWFTNSYHYSVFEEVDAFTKLSVESKFQLHSKGGAVSYVEVPDLQNNLEALHAVVKHIYEHVLYAEFNLRTMDFCSSCGFEGELKIDKEGKWYCPECGQTSHDKLFICKRICGYLGNTFPNRGKSLEMRDRVQHLK